MNAIAIGFSLITAITSVVPIHFPKVENLYTAHAVVVEANDKTDELTFRTDDGNEWVIIGVEDWFVDDYAILLMDSRGTADITDDIIVRERYIG